MGETTNSVVSMLVTQATSFATDMKDLITQMGPIVIGVIVAVLLLTGGIALFKKLTGKAK